MAESQVELHGEVPEPLPGSTPRETGPDPGERITVTVVVRSRADAGALADAVRALAGRRPHERPALSAEEYERRFGSSPEDLEAVEAFAAGHGLQVVEASAARNVVELSGTLAAFSRAFGVRFRAFHSPRRPYRSHDGPILIPRELRGIVENVIGLDDRPILSPAAAASTGSEVTKLVYTDPRTLAGYYRFPAGATGAGQCVAVLQFGGGYLQSDMEAYFGLRGIPCPEMALVELSGQTNQPASPEVMRSCANYLGLTGSPPGADDGNVYKANSSAFWATLECTMDLQILGTVAPGARLVTYMAPDTPQGKYTAFSKAIFDSQYAPAVINCSWGSCESQTPPSSMQSLDQLFQRAALKGVTICASSGDFGDGASTCGGKPSGHFPATSPHALACGGSSVAADLSQETSWYEVISGFPMSGGGGYSQTFAVPSWQQGAVTGQTGRGFPDVAAKADIMSGYDVLVTGLDLPMGGTSAASPLWAGLVAAINQQLGRPVGYLTSLLYSADFSQALRAITKSGGGSCQPTSGWNPCTGLGSPLGTELLAALSAESKSPD